MKGLCLIPARGGSKRLPRKNVLNFKGKPIISYSIEAALRAEIFEDVIVSTDDEVIAEVSQKWGAQVCYRSEELSDDQARVVDVCADYLKNNAGFDYDFFGCLYATSPLRTSSDIRGTYDLLEREVCHFSMAVTNYFFPPHQALKENSGRYLQPMWPELNSKKSQDVPDFYVDNGSTYFCFVEDFLISKNFYGDTLRGYFMPQERSVDIDTDKDFKIAEYFWEMGGR